MNTGRIPTMDELVDAHAPVLYRYAYRLSGRAADAEDVVQETFLVAQRKLHQLRDPRAAIAWLLKIARSVHAAQGRNRIPVSSIPVDEVAEEVPGEAPGIDEVDADRLFALIEQMPAEFRDPLLLFYLQELRYREIAQVLDCPIGTVMSRLARAKAYLRSRLAPERCPD